jgi:hypothetical protein
MKINQMVLIFALLTFVYLLSIGGQQSFGYANAETTIKSTHKAGLSEISSKSFVLDESLLPRISFEKTVFDLGDVGKGTKNECEFRFANTGRGLLKIGKISRTCGCTVFNLDKKQYVSLVFSGPLA